MCLWNNTQNTLLNDKKQDIEYLCRKMERMYVYMDCLWIEETFFLYAVLNFEPCTYIACIKKIFKGQFTLLSRI